MSSNIVKMSQDVQKRIRDMAYLMWELAGRHHGMAMEYWLAAEREIRKTLEAAAHKIMPSSGPHEGEQTAGAAEAGAAPDDASAPPSGDTREPGERPPKIRADAGAAAGTAAPALKPEEPAAAASPARAGRTGYKLATIEGIGPARAAKLSDAGIVTTGQLLERCGSRQGRESTAETTGLDAGQLLKWTNMADLMRISGVGGEFAELLEAAGVDTVKELRNRKPELLTAKMAKVNAEKKLTRRLASAKQVAKWVEQAKSLDPIVTH